jgi:hypothetical protein
MTSHALRLYVASVTLLAFFVLWAVIAAKPWASTGHTGPDPRLVALNRRQRRLERETRAVKQELNRRWLDYRRRLKTREALIHQLEHRHAAQVAAARAAASAAAVTYSSAGASAAPAAQVVTAAPQVRVVTLPPATSSGSSHP